MTEIDPVVGAAQRIKALVDYHFKLGGDEQVWRLDDHKLLAPDLEALALHALAYPPMRIGEPRFRGVVVDVTVNTGGELAYDAVVRLLSPLGVSLRAVRRTGDHGPYPIRDGERPPKGLFQASGRYRAVDKDGQPADFGRRTGTMDLTELAESAAAIGGSVQQLWVAEEWRDHDTACHERHPDWPALECVRVGDHPTHELQFGDEAGTSVLWGRKP